VAPSGQGKSTLTIQAAASFACGLEAFGLKPSQVPLRSTIIQAEDNRGDLVEMWQVIKHMGLSPAQKKLVEQNTWVETVNNIRGEKFTKALDTILTLKPCDLCWINPYAVYVGGSIRDDDANNRFLYEWLNPVLEKHNCGAPILAHTPKTQFRDTTKFKPTDWMYAGAGAAVLTQWARGIIVIDPSEVAGVYRFIAAKREKRLGWDNNELYFAHSGEGKLLWVPASKEQKRAAEKSAKNAKTVDLDRVLEIVPALDPELKTIIESRVRSTLSVGRNLAKEALGILQYQQKIFTRYMDNPAKNGKKGRPFEGWSRSPEGN
jgi:RecA-family ATPase